MAKAKKSKKKSLRILLTRLSFRELRKKIPDRERVIHVDVTKIIQENFGADPELNDIRCWIINQIIIKKIEGFRASKFEKIYITLGNPDKKSIKSFKELMRDHKISPVSVEVYPS